MRGVRATPVWVVLAFLGFLTFALLQRAFVPWPDDLGRTKWDYFVAHKDEYDALWIGSSHVFRDVDNPTIDAELAKRGIELSSFNFGIGGLDTFEQDFVLHRLLELEPARLRYVFLEGGPVGMNSHPKSLFQDPDLNTMRSVYWHTPEFTGKVMAQIPKLPVSPWRKFKFLFSHARLLCRNLANYGLGPEIPSTLDGPKPPPQWLLDGHGFRPYDGEHSEDYETREEYEAVIAGIEAESAQTVAAEDVHTEVHRAQYAAADARGIRLIYVDMPADRGSPERRSLHAQGVIRELWLYNEPSLYPELFEYENRWDKNHLNERGIRHFTDLLVDRIAGLFEGDQ